MTINEKLSKIQVEFKSKKSRFNSFGKYNFRSAEDILEATKPFLKELNVTVTVDEELVSFDPPVMQVTATISDGKDTINSKAIVGVDLDQMPQRYGAASSYGKKYALGNLFLIDDTQDSDATNTHGKATAAKQTMTNESLAKAKEYLKKGGSLDAIKAKYVVTKKHETLLTL
jgi:hypothetical protein